MIKGTTPAESSAIAPGYPEQKEILITISRTEGVSLILYNDRTPHRLITGIFCGFCKFEILPLIVNTSLTIDNTCKKKTIYANCH